MISRSHARVHHFGGGKIHCIARCNNIHSTLSTLPKGFVKGFQSLMLCAVILLLGACNPPQQAAQVDHLPMELLQSLKSNDLEKAMTYYSPEFFKTRPEQKWRERLNQLLRDNGPITTISFRNKQADTRFSGKFYIYQYDTVHGKKRIKHIFTFVRPVDSEEVNLVGHKISG
jgi:hypothetical protein